MLIIFPSDYFDIKQVDPMYTAEYEAVCKIPEFKTILFNHDAFVEDGTVKIYPKDYYTGDCILRGWMLTPEQYASLYSHLSSKGIKLINAPEQYNACHLLPNALPYIEQHTPKSLVFPQGTAIDWDLVNRTFKIFMVKDYVKSVKETNFPTFFETPVEADEMNRRIAEFTDHRGKLFTGGIVLREFVDFKLYGDTTNEYRAFYMHGQPLSITRNSNQSESCPSVPSDFVNSFTGLESNFYTVDFAELADGSWIVIETGDGQVSGLSPGQWEFKYYDDLRNILSENYIDILDNAVVLVKEPLNGFTPNYIRLWLSEKDTDADLAEALALVDNKAGWLHHELNDGLEQPKLAIAINEFKEWWVLKRELDEKIIAILKSENESGKADHIVDNTPYRSVMKPFMERHGYYDGAGWWVKE